MRGSGSQPLRVVGEGQLDADHPATLENKPAGALYPGILAAVEVERFRQVPMLPVLPPARLEQLAHQLPVKDVSPGQVVARLGDPAGHLVILESGTLVAAIDTSEGAQVRVAIVEGPCVVDKAAALHQARHTATWTATTACRLRLLSATMLRQLRDEEPALRQHVLRYLAAEVNAHRHASVRRAERRPIARVADWLLQAYNATGPSIPLPRGQQGLGEELGLSRVSVNRALSALVATGAARVQPRLVVVPRTPPASSIFRP